VHYPYIFRRLTRIVTDILQASKPPEAQYQLDVLIAKWGIFLALFSFFTLVFGVTIVMWLWLLVYTVRRKYTENFHTHHDFFRPHFRYIFGNLPQNICLQTLVHGTWCFILARPNTHMSDGIAFDGTHRYTYHTAKALFVRTVVIENLTRRSRISLFGLSGGRHSEKIHLHPSAEACLTRKEDSNALAVFSIIPVLTVCALLLTNIPAPLNFSRIQFGPLC